MAKVIPTTKQYIHTSLNKMSSALEKADVRSLELKKIKVGNSRIPKDIRRFFRVTNNDEIGRIRKMSTIRGISYFFENFMPVDIIRLITKTELAEEKLELKILKEKIGLKVTKGEMFLEAVPAEPDVSTVLRCRSFDPLIHMQTYFWSEPEKPFGIANTYFRSCYFKYKVNLEINSF